MENLIRMCEFNILRMSVGKMCCGTWIVIAAVNKEWHGQHRVWQWASKKGRKCIAASAHSRASTRSGGQAAGSPLQSARPTSLTPSQSYLILVMLIIMVMQMQIMFIKMMGCQATMLWWIQFSCSCCWWWLWWRWEWCWWRSSNNWVQWRSVAWWFGRASLTEIDG